MWRCFHLLHRWLGIALGLLVLVWLLSGLVMLFVARPELRAEERERALTAGATATAMPLAAPAVDAGAAWAALGRSGAPEALRLQQQLGRPVWLFQAGKTWHAVDALDGRPRVPLDALQAASLAAAYGQSLAGRPLAVRWVELLDGPDQWSVYSRFNAQRPLYRVALDAEDGLELYIAQRSGELVLDTRRWERGWNWLGSVTHWLYFTPLRIDGKLWREVVLWSSGIALGLCALGLVLGVQRLRLRRRYASGSVSPYREPWQRWHHLLGLGGGLVLAAWIFSGWLSMDPWGWPGGDGPAAGEQQRWRGGALEPAALRMPPQLPAGTGELAAQRFQGTHFWLATTPTGTALIDPQGQVLPAGLDDARLRAAAQSLQPQATIVAAGWLHEPDLHYYALRHQRRSFPVYRVAFDEPSTGGLVYYLDPRTARVVLRLDEAGRWNRWLFNALHRWDLPPLVGLPLARDGVVIALSLLGLGLTSAGLVLGVRRLRKQQQQRISRPKKSINQ
ncbi:hypothetical protein G8A07_12275 [Roseateles sp. DAIF2]|uniref:PepSY domain-containing protein n=1 Tax=Roseateles sp. DAIF2 TaxID=2714952 RepID=UPI0018A33A92|nr:PepSY domain-containing protein [Roseateles sp. DAIF2]QPF73624.1 hypothetical protein G8A07_12275 [Roseateles sp. DAIF2]